MLGDFIVIAGRAVFKCGVLVSDGVVGCTALAGATEVVAGIAGPMEDSATAGAECRAMGGP